MINLRLYINDLEKNSELYKLELNSSSVKDSLLTLKNLQLLNRDSVILEHTNFIKFQTTENKRLEQLNKDLSKAYKRQRVLTPIIAGGSVAVTLVLCYLLVK